MRYINARFTIALAGAMLASAGSCLAVDSTLLNLVMPDAQIMAGVNVTNAEATPLGAYLLAQISANGAGLQEVINATGFDPRKDVTEVLAASNGNAAAPAALVMSKGVFDVDKIVASVGSSKKPQVSTYAGATLITIGADSGGSKAQAIAFLGGTVAIVGDLTSVKAALDRSSGVNSISPALATQVQTLSTTEDAWSISLASLGALFPGASTEAPAQAAQVLQLVKNIQSCSAGLKFGANVQFTAQATADTPQDATALGDVIKMVASLAAMSGGTNKDAAAFAQLLQSLQVTASGATVNLSASVPEAQVEALLNSALMPHEKIGKTKM